MSNQQYTPDRTGFFCALCGKTSIRQIAWHGKRLCNLPKKDPAHD